MKKLIIVLIFMVVLSPAVFTPIFAQNYSSGDRGDMFYLNVPVEKVYPSSSGYIVQYRKNGFNEIGTVGLPNEWFTEAGGRAEIIKLPRGRNWPSLSIFYKNGEFSHVRLYVHSAKGHQTWGNIPQGADVSRHFSGDPDTLNIEY